MKENDRYSTVSPERRNGAAGVLVTVTGAWLCIALYKTAGRFVMKAVSDSYLAYLISQLIQVALAFLFAHMLRERDLFRKDGRGRRGWIAAIPLLLHTAFLLFMGTPEMDSADITAAEALCFIAQMLLIGLGEELLFRGLVQRSMHRAFGEKSTGRVIAAVILSGIVFGATHLGNAFLSSVSLGAAASQAAVTSFMGMYLGAIYYRTGKDLIFISAVHGLYDMAAMIVNGRLRGEEMGEILEQASSFSPAGILLWSAVYLAAALIVLRPGRTAKLLDAAQTADPE